MGKEKMQGSTFVLLFMVLLVLALRA